VPELDQKYIARAKKAAREAFPEMAGVEPSVSTRKTHGKGGIGMPLHVLTFQKSVSLPDGGHMARVVRVTMDGRGEIVKLSSSK
jgi:hypothetical protein